MSDYDPFNQLFPKLRLDDLAPRNDDLPVKLSILMSINNFRAGQLARSLECLCRQNWKEFEVLVCDNGSPEDLEKVFQTFDPYLRLKTIRLERSRYSACPSVGLRALFPEAEGEVWAITQPEIMLLPNVAFFLYDAHFNEWPDTISYKIAMSPVSTEGLPTWVIPKVGAFNKQTFLGMDDVDWHSDLRNLEELPEFMTHQKGFSYSSNQGVARKLEYPWWFTASAKADAGIWKDMPIFNVHASIDQWLLTYRRLHEYVDICTRQLAGYHQWHHRGQQVVEVPEEVPEPVISDEEKATWLKLEIDELRQMCMDYGLAVGSDQDFDALWEMLNEARVFDREVLHTPTSGSRPHPVETVDGADNRSARLRRIRGD